MILIDPSAQISPNAEIEDSVRGTSIVVGARSHIDSFVKVKPAGGHGDLIIGDDCNINSGCVLYTGNGISIGAGVAIAANCTFAPVNHEFHDRDIPIRQQGFRPSKGGIIIENDVWIGSNCVILDGAVLREGCVIGAMSLVRGEVPPFAIAAGNPMSIVGCRR